MKLFSSRLFVISFGLCGALFFPAPSAPAGNTVLNGAAPRPFYAVAHNPNVLVDINNAIAHGFNAMEPDITMSDDCSGAQQLVCWDSDFPFRDGSCTDLHLADWCDFVHTKAKTDPNFKISYIAFDTKHPVAADGDDTAAARGQEILDTIRTHLNYDGVNIHFVISVGTHDDAPIFRDIYDQIDQTQEGLQIDAEDDAADVVNF